MDRVPRTLCVVLAVCGLLAACSTRSEAPAADTAAPAMSPAPVTGMVDSSTMKRDSTATSGGAMAGHTTPPVIVRRESPAASLDSSHVRLTADRQLTAARPATVLLRIARGAPLPRNTADAARQAVHDTAMLVGDSARACLTIPPSWKFADGTPSCRTQSVFIGTDNTWVWTAVPDAAGDSVPISATVTALLPGRPPREFYSGSLTVRVVVAPCPLYRTDCLTAAVATWQGIVTGLGALCAAAAGLVAWGRKRQAGREATTTT